MTDENQYEESHPYHFFAIFFMMLAFLIGVAAMIMLNYYVNQVYGQLATSLVFLGQAVLFTTLGLYLWNKAEQSVGSEGN